jgi:hypothetical protein
LKAKPDYARKKKSGCVLIDKFGCFRKTQLTGRMSSDCDPDGGGEAVSGLTVLIH